MAKNKVLEGKGKRLPSRPNRVSQTYKEGAILSEGASKPRNRVDVQDLKIVEGVLCDTFRDVAERRSLIEVDSMLDEYLTESEQWAMPVSLRRLFATILVFSESGDVRGLWDGDACKMHT